MYGVILAVPLPGPARAAEADGAALRADMAAERLAQVTIKVSAAARRVITEASRSLDIWQTMQRVAQQSQQQADSMMLAYQLGEATLTEALNTRCRMAGFERLFWVDR
ncbi:MAG: TolC family protein [Burkholderiaceae bacterium]